MLDSPWLKIWDVILIVCKTKVKIKNDNYGNLSSDIIHVCIFFCFSISERVTPRLAHANAAVVLSAVKVREFMSLVDISLPGLVKPLAL